MKPFAFRLAARSGAMFVLVQVSSMNAAVAAVPAQAFDIQEVTSPKGIKAWLVEDHTIPMMAMNFSFAGGAAQDPVGKEGLAYFMGGMLDEGAGDLKSAAYQAKMQDLNMRMNFSASKEDFSGSLQTLTRNRAAAVDMLKLAVNSPRFDAEPLERVRKQILLTQRSEREDPESIAGDAWMATMFPGHPYGRDDKGTEGSLKAITAQDLHDLHQRLFARDTLLIAVVGDITADQLKPILDEVFGDLPEKSGMVPVAVPKLAKGPLVKVVDRDIPQSVIRFGFAGIKRDDPDFIPAYVMNFILGDGGFGSRLMEEVREKRGLSYGVYSFLYPFDQAGVVYGGAATQNARVGETIEVIKAEMKRMADSGATAKELENAKTYLTGSYPLRFDSNRKIADQLLGIQREKLGIDYIKKRNGLINAVTLADIQRLAKKLIDADHMVFVVVGRPKDVKSEG